MARHRTLDGGAGIRFVAWALAVLLGGMSALIAPHRFATDDAISYLDIADQYLHGEWHAAVNGYWSPLYSVVLAAAGSVVRPAPAAEILFVRSVDFILLLFSLGAFERVLHRLVDGDVCVSRVARLALGYAAFLWSSLVWIGARTDTPDMLAAGCFYAAAAFVADDAVREWRRSVLAGALCALAYLSKAGMLPAVAALLIAHCAAANGPRAAATRLALAVPVFALVAGVLVVPLSHTRHRFTVGDVGSMNYVWYVHPTRRAVPNEHWQGGPAGFGTPIHPTRRIFANPDAFEFDGPVHGTYPPWTDPSYWYEGLHARFDAAAQQRVVRSNLGVYAATFLAPLLFLAAVVFCLGGLRASLTDAIAKRWPLLVAACVGLASYAIGTDLAAADILTQPSTRFVAPFATLAFVVLVGAVRLPDAGAARAASRASWLAAGGVAVATCVAVCRVAAVAAAAETPVPIMVARELHRFGLADGDRVAILGRKYDRGWDHEFWARLGRFRIIDQVPNDRAALELSPERWDDLCAMLASTGARALVYRTNGDDALSRRWTPVSNGFYVYRLTPRSSGE